MDSNFSKLDPIQKIWPKSRGLILFNKTTCSIWTTDDDYDDYDDYETHAKNRCKHNFTSFPGAEEGKEKEHLVDIVFTSNIPQLNMTFTS